MSVIRVAHVTTVPMSLRYLLLNQLLSIQANGYEVVGISAPGPEVPEVEAAGVRHIAVSMTRNFTPGHDLLTLWRLYRVMRRERFTIVHTHTPKPGLLGQLAARLAGVPIVINTLHGFYFHDHMQPFWRRFYIATEKIAAYCSDVILSQSREDIEIAIEEKICKAGKIKHLGNGIDLTLFDPTSFMPDRIASAKRKLGIPPESDVVGFVGRLAGQRKGFLNFLSACQTVRRQLPQVYFLVVGEADHGKPDAVEPEIAAEYGLADRMLFLGMRPNSELPVLYRVMNVLVLPSLFEGLPRVLMEASAMKIPAIATDVKGNREAVFPGQNGFLVPWGNDQLLAESIVAVLADQPRAAAMGESGRRIALERFDEQRVFSTVKAEYARLLRAKHLPVPQATGH